MERFGYIRAETVPHAVALLNEAGIRSRVLAGGTDLVLIARGDRRLGNPEPCPWDRVVDITLIPELHSIRQEDGRVVIGAAASFTEIMESPIVRATAPVLAEACRQVGAVQIRNMGTLGGNVANAAACADSLPALVCLDATGRVLTASEPYEWQVSDLVLRPNHTKIPPGGLLVSLSYAEPPPGSRSVFLKLGRRKAMAISRLTVAALGRLDDDSRIEEIRLVPGAATPQVRRFASVEASLLGRAPAPGLFEEAGRLAVSEMASIAGRRWSSEYKEPALASMVTRVLRSIFLPAPEQ